MRITVMAYMAKSLHPPPLDPDVGLTTEVATKLTNEVYDDLAQLKWFCWHGNVSRALQTVDDLIIDLETLHPGDEPSKLLTAVREFDGYLRANAERIPNYGERRRAGEAISTAFTESAVNQVISKRMVKKQQMRWTPRRPPTPSDPHPRLNDQLADNFHAGTSASTADRTPQRSRRSSPKMLRSLWAAREFSASWRARVRSSSVPTSTLLERSATTSVMGHYPSRFWRPISAGYRASGEWLQRSPQRATFGDVLKISTR
jgi:hypothetical protein